MNRRNSVFLIMGIVLMALIVFSAQSDARVDVSIGINLPAYTFAAPPPLVVIPGTYAYFVPGIELDVLFYRGYWYRPYEGLWYRARAYNGPWAYIAPARVPRGILELPPGYRHVPPGQRYLPYKEYNKNWRRWERERYWEREEWWREGRRAEHRERERHH